MTACFAVFSYADALREIVLVKTLVRCYNNVDKTAKNQTEEIEMKVKIIRDSTADLSPELIKQYDISVMAEKYHELYESLMSKSANS